MATGKKYFWIKLKTDFMTSDKVDYLMSQTNGAEYVVLYQMLCMKCINTDGLLARQIGEVIIPFDAEKIARDCKYFSVDTVKQAFQLFIQLGMIYQETNGYLRIADFENMVGSETDWAAQKKKQKENGLPKLTLGITKRVNENSIRLPDGKIKFVDEKRYGGNGALAYDLAGCICEKCGKNDENLLIHHNNGYSNNVEDLVILCKSCHGVAHDSIHNGVLSQNEITYRHYGEKTSGNKVEDRVEDRVELFHTEIDIRDRVRDRNLNSKSCDKSQAKNLIDAWFTTYLEIYGSKPDACIPEENRKSFYASINKQLQTKLKTYDADTMLKTLNYAKNDTWVINNGFTIQLVFSDTEIQKALQNQPYNSGQQIKIQNNFNAESLAGKIGKLRCN